MLCGEKEGRVSFVSAMTGLEEGKGEERKETGKKG